MILAANDDERDDINIVRLDEAVYSSRKLKRSKRQAAYNMMMILLLIKSSKH
jgi:hypothetical protein